MNNKAVSEIAYAYEHNEFIPNTLTFNIPMETNFDFYYDEDSCTLIINSLPYFDISDGYHRYVAMCRERDVNPSFNIPWELRIINFSDSNHNIYSLFCKNILLKR